MSFKCHSEIPGIESAHATKNYVRVSSDLFDGWKKKEDNRRIGCASFLSSLFLFMILNNKVIGQSIGDKYIQEAVYRSQLRMSHGYMLGGKKEKQWWELENEI